MNSTIDTFNKNDNKDDNNNYEESRLPFIVIKMKRKNEEWQIIDTCRWRYKLNDRRPKDLYGNVLKKTITVHFKYMGLGNIKSTKSYILENNTLNTLYKQFQEDMKN